MKLLIDSDFLVGLFREGDAHYHQSVNILQKVNESRSELYVSDLVLQETGTVLSYRVGPAAVQLFHENFPKLDALQIRLDESLEEKSWKLFVDQTKKGYSFVDCSNIILQKEFMLDKIISFDSFYPKELRF